MALDIADKITKLIELALHNPNIEESRSAAMMACRLLDQFKVPIGDQVVNINPQAEWVPPSPDFMQTVADIFAGTAKNPDAAPIPESQGGAGYGGAVMIQDREMEDAQSAFRAQVVRAWRAIRETRKSMEADIHRYEHETHRKFTGRGW